MDLALNLFRVRLEPESLLLPVCVCGSWEESTALLKGRLKEYQVVRSEQTDHSVRVIAISGPTAPEDMASENVTLLQDPGAASRIIRTAIAMFFSNEGMLIERDRFDIFVLRPTPDYENDALLLRTGVSLSVKRPFRERPEYFVCANWEVRAQFKIDLSAPVMQSMAVGCPVLYRPSQNAPSNSNELDSFRGKYLGRVIELNAGQEAIVSCRDRVNRAISLSALYAEASPTVIAEFERRSSCSPRQKSSWHRIQELSLVLTSQGRRNGAVLRDRLDAVRKFLGGELTSELGMKASTFGSVQVFIDLRPSRASSP